MGKYYYFIGHDWSKERQNTTEAFIEFDSIQELANYFESYEGNIEKALNDDEYVFSEEEYLNYIN